MLMLTYGSQISKIMPATIMVWISLFTTHKEVFSLRTINLNLYLQNRNIIYKVNNCVEIT